VERGGLGLGGGRWALGDAGEEQVGNADETEEAQETQGRLQRLGYNAGLGVAAGSKVS
jgi:hypothetical protein